MNSLVGPQTSGLLGQTRYYAVSADSSSPMIKVFEQETVYCKSLHRALDLSCKEQHAPVFSPESSLVVTQYFLPDSDKHVEHPVYLEACAVTLGGAISLLMVDTIRLAETAINSNVTERARKIAGADFITLGEIANKILN